jgi:hypothetical protein
MLIFFWREMGEFKVVSLARLSAGRSVEAASVAPGAVALEAGYGEIPTSQSLYVKGNSVEFYPDASRNQTDQPNESVRR